ncbi:MAG TPA: TetR family transcriptional regulator [Candidatus Dormibacteraeota bacterium]|jgi:AcrR family transcriptional regulator|nr:TetR family transcriptional regulator [Candidatus Dormibacteraeota bacterium]
MTKTKSRPVGRPPLATLTPDGLDRRAQIIDAATTVIANRGYAHTSLKDIADAAGVTPALIYHYFDSKEDLLLATMASVQENLHRAVDAARERETEPFERIAVTVDEAAAQFDLHPEFFRLIYDMYSAGLSQPSLRKKGLEMLEHGIQRQVEQIRAYYSELGGVEPPVPAEDLAGAIVAAVDGIAVSATVRGVDPAGMYRGLKMILLFAAALPYAATTGTPPDINRLLELVREAPAGAAKEEAQ